MGCSKSKAPKAAAAAAASAQEHVVAAPPTPHEEPKPLEHKEEVKLEVKVPVSLKVKIASAHGLRPADMVGKKSEVYVDFHLEGRPQSKVTTKTILGKAALRLGAAPGEKESVEVHLDFEAALANYEAGDKIVFTVKDKDCLTSDVLGKAIITDGSFGGKLELEDAGAGYKAFLMVQLGDGNAMLAALVNMKAEIEEASRKVAAAITDTIGAENIRVITHAVENANHKAHDAIENVQVKSGLWCGC